jgi:hypothetical protein
MFSFILFLSDQANIHQKPIFFFFARNKNSHSVGLELNEEKISLAATFPILPIIISSKIAL